MSTGTERSKSLHNFTMPHELRWGNQRFLRCLKVNSDGRISPLRRNNGVLHSRTARDGKIDSCSDGSRKVGRTSPDSGCDDGIAAIREKVILDLQTAADEMKHAIFKDGRRPWNLRTRRADLNSPAAFCNIDAAAGKGPVVNAPKLNFGLPVVIDKPMKLRSGGGAAASGGKQERPKFSVALSKNEIEEDFYSMAGRRPPRRPKKRARNVQRQLDTLFPGLWLSEVTPDLYEVPQGEGR